MYRFHVRYLIFVVPLVLSLIGCGPSPSPPPPSTTTTTIAPSPSPSPSPSPTPVCFDLVAPVESPTTGHYVPTPFDPDHPAHLSAILDIRERVGGCSPADPYGKLTDTAWRMRDEFGVCAGTQEENLLVRKHQGSLVFEVYYPITIPTGCFATQGRMYKGDLQWVPRQWVPSE